MREGWRVIEGGKKEGRKEIGMGGIGKMLVWEKKKNREMWRWEFKKCDENSG